MGSRLVKLDQNLFWIVELALEVDYDDRMKTASLELARQEGWHWTLARHPDYEPEDQTENELIESHLGSDEKRWRSYPGTNHTL